MPMLLTVANLDPVFAGAMLLAMAFVGFVLGNWFAARRRPNTDQAPLGRTTTSKRSVPEIFKPDLTDDDDYFELWERLLDACYRDFRVQAVAGYDRGFFDTLHEPLITEAEEDNAPLLPGEIAFGEVLETLALAQYWRRRQPKYERAVQVLEPEEQTLYHRCLKDALQALDARGKENKLYRLVVRTPRHQHVVLFSSDLRSVLCVVPGPPGFDDPFF